MSVGSYTYGVTSPGMHLPESPSPRHEQHACQLTKEWGGRGGEEQVGPLSNRHRTAPALRMRRMLVQL
eukprot:7713478-Alexandrium_andersonii.AAC.1